jgi:hypothetical protein
MSLLGGISQRARDAESSLEKVKRQLSTGSGRYLLQGPLLKRSETVCRFFAPQIIFPVIILYYGSLLGV